MTVTNTACAVTYTGNGSNKNWSFNFPTPDATFMTVSLLQISTAVTTSVPSNQFTVALNTDGTGVITYPLGGGTPISTDYKITLERVVPLEQLTELTNQGDFNPVVIESALDYLVMITQQLNQSISGLDAVALTAIAAAVTAAVAAFNNEYLGSHATDPTGTVIGQLYFNTTSNVMKVWNGSTWLVTYNPAVTGVNSFNGRTGVVAPANGDYSIGQITGAATVAATGAFSDLIGPPPFGQCRLTFTDATHIKLSPFNGNFLTINGANYAVPAVGVSITNGGLAASTWYYVYAYMNSGTMTLELSTTGHSTAANGVETKNIDTTRTLVGMVYMNGSAQFTDPYGTLTWFNRRLKSWQIIAGSSIITSSTILVGTLGQPFICWNDVFAMQAASLASNDTAGSAPIMACGMDGTAFGQVGGASSGIGGEFVNLSCVGSQVLTEGVHTAALMVAVAGGGIGTYYPGDTGYTVSYFG